MSRPEYAGGGFLMRLGYTLIWSGWQGDLIDRGGNVVARLPLAEARPQFGYTIVRSMMRRSSGR